MSNVLDAWLRQLAETIAKLKNTPFPTSVVGLRVKFYTETEQYVICRVANAAQVMPSLRANVRPEPYDKLLEGAGPEGVRMRLEYILDSDSDANLVQADDMAQSTRWTNFKI